MINKPYYRIYRPINNDYHANCEYIVDLRNCSERGQLIRVYQMLVSEVLDIFRYIEPVRFNYDVYSLQLYSVLTRTCMEIENHLKGILITNGYTVKNMNMVDYYKVNNALKLHEYEVNSYLYDIGNLSPFQSWGGETYSCLPWYNAYNNVKHDRHSNLTNASLKNVICALSGLYVLLFAQFHVFAECISYKNALIYVTYNDSVIVGSENRMGFDILREPTWSDTEKYDFTWDTLTTTPDPYQQFVF